MKAIKIGVNDSVAVAVCEIKSGESVSVGSQTVLIKSDIPMGHKFALCDIKKGQDIIKYSAPIGHALCDIKEGEHLHTHNVKTNLNELLDYTYCPNYTELEKSEPREFIGYRRKDGSVAIRNEVWIVPTVGCICSVAKEMEKLAQRYKTENIDGIYCYTHPYGCSQLGDDMQMTLKFLSGLIRHPNAAAVLVVGLGCENGNIDELKKVLGSWDDERVKFLNAQDFEDEIAEGDKILQSLCAYADGFRREKCSASELVIGLKCGGSDAFSGITANPLVGSFSDKLISQGGSTILTEVPEMFGAETILMNRCRSQKEFDKTVSLINNFKKYFMKYGEEIYENPSPGNKAGGITTLEDKSLGCTQKGGTAPVEDVLCYGEKIKKRGLSLLQAPGNDLVAANALVASGAHIVLFTTGRGTPFACPVPTVKISSNSKLYNKKTSWIDFNAGKLLDGQNSEEVLDEFFDFILDVASGKKHAKSERLDKSDVAIFKDGVTL